VPEPQPSPETVEEVPAAPIEELKRLAGELQTESAQLLETYTAFLEKKENDGGEITDADEELEELIESFAGTAEKLNGQLAGGGFFARLRNRKDTDARPQLQKRFKALADRGAQVDRLMGQVQPSPEVRQAWQEIRRDWQRVGSIISGLK
jgi:DNA repair exonuclease SbcCD ATPase subunit